MADVASERLVGETGCLWTGQRVFHCTCLECSTILDIFYTSVSSHAQYDLSVGAEDDENLRRCGRCDPPSGFRERIAVIKMITFRVI